MSITAENFIPNEAKVEAEKVYFQSDVKNLVEKEEIEGYTRGCIDDYEARFIGQRDEWDAETDGIWNLQDAMWRSGLNDSAVQSEKSIGANEPDTWERAKTGSTLFYRQVRQKASNGYAVQTSRPMPFKYDTISDTEYEADKDSEDKSERMNLLAKWSMKQDRFNIKSIDFWTQVYKYGNVPVMVEWKQVIGKKKISVPKFADDGVTIDGYDIRDIDSAKINRPTFKVLPIESLYADTAIGNIQDQECVIVTTVVSITEIIDGIQKGLYREDLLEMLNQSHQWDGFSGRRNEEDKKDNRGIEQGPSTATTGQYLKREVFVNMPIDEDDETWDELKNVPKRYRVTMIGNQPTNAIIARIERNQEPDDSIPIEIIHANPDDDDLLYHISDYEVIRSNIATETTIIRQTIDNNTLVNKPPLVEVEGSVRGNDRSFGPNARYIVDQQGDIIQLNVRDLSQTNIQLLEYIKDDSNTANSIDKNMVGESFGARTTASEATTITANSRRPNVVNIEYILEQLFGFVAQRYKVLWEAYGRHDQIIQITNDNEQKVFIKPTEINGDFDIVIDILDEIKDDEVKAQRLINGATVFAGNPQLSSQVDWTELGKELAKNIFGTEKFIVGQKDGDVINNAKNNLALILNNGQTPTFTPDMNLDKHLKIYKDVRQKWVGREDENENVEILDNVIAQLEQMTQEQPDAQAGSQQALPQGQAQLQQQLTSGAIGGIQ